MEDIRKFLLKLPSKLRSKVIAAMRSIQSGQTDALDIKPLKGHQGWYRCRIGAVRIVFIRTSHGTHVVYDVQFRDKAYNKL
jgi:mRNA-degrading endonuclease RelE of RelBE toxin-antitoxin system